MKKFFSLLILVCTLLIGCADKMQTLMPADNSSGTPTSTPATVLSDTPTGTPATVLSGTPTGTPATVLSDTPTPAVDREKELNSIAERLREYVGTIEHGNMLRLFKELSKNVKFSIIEEIDCDSELPWGSITGITTENGVIVFHISNGYNYTKKIVKEGMTISEFAKLVEDGSGYTIKWVSESNKPDGTILSVEEYTDGHAYFTEKHATALVVAGNERTEEILPSAEKVAVNYLGVNVNKTKPSIVILGEDYGQISSKADVYSSTGKILRGFPKTEEENGLNYNDLYLYYDNEYDADDRLIRTIKYYADKREVICEYTYLEDSGLNDRFGLWEGHRFQERIDYYDAVVGNSSDCKNFAGYEIIEKFHSDYDPGFYIDKDCSITGFGVTVSWTEHSVYRADNTLQAKWVINNSSQIGDSSEAKPFYTIEIYDEKGLNPQVYEFANNDIDNGIIIDSYDRVIVSKNQ